MSTKLEASANPVRRSSHLKTKIDTREAANQSRHTATTNIARTGTKQLSHNLKAHTRRLPICTKHNHSHKNRHTASAKLNATHDRASILVIKADTRYLPNCARHASKHLAIKADTRCLPNCAKRTSNYLSYKSRHTAAAKLCSSHEQTF